MFALPFLFMKTKAEIQQYIHRYEQRRKKYKKALKNNSKVLIGLRKEYKTHCIREQEFKNLKNCFNNYWGENVKFSESKELKQLFCYVCSQYTGLGRFGIKYINFTPSKWKYATKKGNKLAKTINKEQCLDLKKCIVI